jgi:hypothetical protein
MVARNQRSERWSQKYRGIVPGDKHTDVPLYADELRAFIQRALANSETLN